MPDEANSLGPRAPRPKIKLRFHGQGSIPAALTQKPAPYASTEHHTTPHHQHGEAG